MARPVTQKYCAVMIKSQNCVTVFRVALLSDSIFAMARLKRQQRQFRLARSQHVRSNHPVVLPTLLQTATTRMERLQSILKMKTWMMHSIDVYGGRILLDQSENLFTMGTVRELHFEERKPVAQKKLRRHICILKSAVPFIWVVLSVRYGTHSLKPSTFDRRRRRSPVKNSKSQIMYSIFRKISSI